MNREHGGFHCESNHEANEEPAFRVRPHTHIHEVAQEECSVPIVVGIDVESDDGRQHNKTGRQGVQEELNSGVAAAFSPKTTDEEEHRNKSGFEEEVEQENVSGRENVEGKTFHGQREPQESPFAQLILTEVLCESVEQHERGEDGC